MFKLRVLLLFVTFLTGCNVEPVSQAFLDAYHLNFSNASDNTSQPKLNKNFQYLRLQIGQREVFMALGNIDSLAQGMVEVWYSSKGEVLRFMDGRLIGAALNRGTNWSAVTFFPLPRWEKIAGRMTFERSRDLSPGYRYGIKEHMVIQRIEQPKENQLKLISASSLTWFEEHADGAGGLPPTRYAVNFALEVPLAVYGEQCLSNDFCFSWQRWTPLKEDKH